MIELDPIFPKSVSRRIAEREAVAQVEAWLSLRPEVSRVQATVQFRTGPEVVTFTRGEDPFPFRGYEAMVSGFEKSHVGE